MEPAPPEPHADETADPKTDRRIGQLVDGKYFVLRRLACGGMGSVYEARHAVVGTHFALKFLHEQYAQRSNMVQRFLREAQAAGSIASEHVISVLDYGSADGTPYLVMELVRGQDLRELLSEQQHLGEQRAIRIVLDACRGLALAHDRGLVHRDLKPANICITRRADGREIAKVIDFGVAKLRDGVDLSEEGTLIGTVGYMAPEQLTDHRQLDARADVYALGVILYQALAGRPPHLCNRSELLYRIVSLDPPPLSELCPELSAGLSEVVQKALSRNKERRYPSARELGRALEPYAGEGLGVTPPMAAPAALHARDPQVRRRRGDFGTAETEVENAPTWGALGRPERRNPHADRHCERQSSPDATQGLLEEFCRQPAGFVASVSTPPRESGASQRALLLSVGALALSVVAMTTMFIFVYSHGERALEVGPVAHAPSAVAAAPAAQRAAPVLAHASLAPEAPARCLPRGSELAPASVLEPGPGGSARQVEVHALQGSSAAPRGPSSGEGLHGALSCD
jgi:eukaryotic-like serine/threonine-protein kinase